MGVCRSAQGLSLEAHRVCRSFAWNQFLLTDHLTALVRLTDDMEHELLGK